MNTTEGALIQASIDGIVERLAELNLNLIVERDFSELRRFMESQGSFFVNPTFHPDIAHKGVVDAFWLRLEDQDGRVVASHADRVFETPDFMETHIRRAELWTGVPGPDPYMEGVEFPPVPVTIGGVVSHSGSMWIDKAWRKKGIATFLSYISRSIHMRNYGTTMHTGLVLEGIWKTDVWSVAYGYPRGVHCLKGYWPPIEKAVDLWICWIDRAESLDAIRALPRHAQAPVRVPGLTEDGQWTGRGADAVSPDIQWTRPSEAISTAVTDAPSADSGRAI